MVILGAGRSGGRGGGRDDGDEWSVLVPLT